MMYCWKKRGFLAPPFCQKKVFSFEALTINIICLKKITPTTPTFPSEAKIPRIITVKLSNRGIIYHSKEVKEYSFNFGMK